MSLQADYNLSRNWIESGEECRGAALCSGWHLSDFDTWHQCPCGNGRHFHPEFGISLPTDASPVWAAAVDGLSFYWASTFANVAAHASDIAAKNSLTVTLFKIADGDEFLAAFPSVRAELNGSYVLTEFSPFDCPRCGVSVTKQYQSLCDACNELPERERLIPATPDLDAHEAICESAYIAELDEHLNWSTS